MTIKFTFIGYIMLAKDNFMPKLHYFNDFQLSKISPLFTNKKLFICYGIILLTVLSSIVIHDHVIYPQDHRTRQLVLENFSVVAPIKNTLDINLAKHGQFLFKDKTAKHLSIEVTQAQHGFTKCEIKAANLKAVTYANDSYKSCTEAAYYFNGLLFQEEQKNIASKKIVVQKPQ